MPNRPPEPPPLPGPTSQKPAPLVDLVGMYADFEVWAVRMYTVQIVDADPKSGKVKILSASRSLPSGREGTTEWVYPASLKDIRPPAAKYSGQDVEPIGDGYRDDTDLLGR